MIPLGDVRDSGSAVLTARGEIDGIDQSGENNPRYGVKDSEETKEKKRQSMLEQWQTTRKGWRNF